ncbi:hypothetical protein GGF40_000198 [Coemansia sp. RSA 1286]|nr:hypothetical protein GGF40_000198 [Coemansia sp. RSA 1286]
MLASSVKTMFTRRAFSNNSTSATPLHVNTKRHSMNLTATAASAVRHVPSAPVLCSSDIQLDGSDRHTEGRAKALADTIRRLHQNSSSIQQDQDKYSQPSSPTQSCEYQPTSPITPSSIDTGKTLPCFPEEDEYSDAKSEDPGSPLSTKAHMDAEKDTEPVYVLSAVTRAGISRLNSTPKAMDTKLTNRYSTSSSLTLAARSRPVSISSAGSENTFSKASLPKHHMQRRHSMMLGDSREALPKISQSKSQTTLAPKPKPMPQTQLHPHSQRYIVPMTQNLNRRFQTPLHHEYEQRIYCLHSHYTDVIERLESQTRMQNLKLRKLEHDLSEVRKSNGLLKSKEAELRSRLQHKTDARMSKKLVDFVDHYQHEMHRMTRETSTAQEWVVTLAELVVGPKKKHQSWDDWLNSCLEVLQQRREAQQKQTSPV